MNILSINHYAGSPDYGMVFRPYYMGREIVCKGHKVTIVTASYSHLRIKNPEVKRDLQEEFIDGIRYLWLKTPSYKRSGVKRVLNMLIFQLKVRWYHKKLGEMTKPDVVVATTPDNICIYPAHKIAKEYKAKLYYEVRDLWPLTPRLIGGYSAYHPFIWMIQKAEDYAYKHCDGVISLLCKAEPYMQEHGLAKGKFHYIPNGINLDDWTGIEESHAIDHEQFLKKLKNEGKFIVGFAGAHGIANSLYSVIDAVNTLADMGVVLALVGSGPEKENLEKYSIDNSIKNVYFMSAVKKKEIPSILKEMDVLYIGLKRQPLFKYGISPNKLFDYMMAGKPIIQAIDSGNDIVGDARCGICVEPDNIEEIAKGILMIKDMTSAERNQLGENGKNYVLRNHSYKVLADNYLDAIK